MNDYFYNHEQQPKCAFLRWRLQVLQSVGEYTFTNWSEWSHALLTRARWVGEIAIGWGRKRAHRYGGLLAKGCALQAVNRGNLCIGRRCIMVEMGARVPLDSQTLERYALWCLCTQSLPLVWKVWSLQNSVRGRAQAIYSLVYTIRKPASSRPAGSLISTNYIGLHPSY